jgi:histidine triad (HIT) family protein
VAEHGCVFCKIVSGQIDSHLVFEDDLTIVFLDNGPLFPGHCLVCLKQHYDTLMDVPQEMLTPLFRTAQLIARGVESGLGAEGSFVAVNNKISQSVPHLHVHVIPRKRGDGMKGFFWPRRPYRDQQHMTETRDALRAAVESLQAQG